MYQDFTYPSCGTGMIHGLRWEPEGDVIAVLQIVHGVAEHGKRYDEFASFMASKGFLVVAQDHMSHGGSLGENGKLGHFAGGWFCAVADVYQLLRDTKAKYPNVPYIQNQIPLVYHFFLILHFLYHLYQRELHCSEY